MSVQYKPPLPPPLPKTILLIIYQSIIFTVLANSTVQNPNVYYKYTRK